MTEREREREESQKAAIKQPSQTAGECSHNFLKPNPHGHPDTIQTFRIRNVAGEMLHLISFLNH